MSRLQKKAEARTKQIVGQMLGDDQLVQEGTEDVRRAEENAEVSQAREEKQKK